MKGDCSSFHAFFLHPGGISFLFFSSLSLHFKCRLMLRSCIRTISLFVGFFFFFCFLDHGRVQDTARIQSDENSTLSKSDSPLESSTQSLKVLSLHKQSYRKVSDSDNDEIRSNLYLRSRSNNLNTNSSSGLAIDSSRAILRSRNPYSSFDHNRYLFLDEESRRLRTGNDDDVSSHDRSSPPDEDLFKESSQKTVRSSSCECMGMGFDDVCLL